ncbi:NAD(P)/FAD-dependent oxidoreductase [Paracoccus sp. NSM]|uniref:NAD(P)/FAD-dependent oxidoreductase n=1 Tax=Paracoccus sp. NSM TaxID=3457784 RepID=UPI004036E65E
MTLTYSARRLPSLAGAAAWDAILPVRAPHPSLASAAKADIVIIGGGFAGLAAARRLLQLDSGLRIALLEAGQVAQGSAGRNSGFMIDLPHELTSEDYAGTSADGDQRMITLNRHAITFAAEAVEDYDIPRDWFRRDGKVNGAVSAHAQAQNAAYARHLDSLGEPNELLDAQAMHELTGSRHYRAGLYTPGTVMLQPAGFIRGMAKGLARRISLYENSPVTRIDRHGGAWRVTTRGGQVDAGLVIMAHNGHLESFGIARGRLMHIFLFATMTPELPPEALARLGGAECWGVTPADPMGTTLRRISSAQGGNRIITRTIAVLRPEMRTTAGQMQRARAMMQRKFDARFPQLAGMQMEHAWAGHLCLARNGASVAGRIEDGLYAACVDNGLGTTRSTLAGIAAAEAALGVASEVTRFFGAQDLPDRLPPPPLAKLGGNLFIRWKEWRARDE